VKSRSRALKPEIVSQSPLWQRAANVRSAIRAALNACADSLPNGGAREVTVVLTDDAAIRVLNRQWRGFDKPTNVLSFPGIDGTHLGDIVIAYETMAREAETDNKRFADHLAHMAIHGLLHLAGFDHETAKDAKKMEQREREILATLGIADPYAQAPATRAPKRKRVSRATKPRSK
jgi:probable rRNA maturation factor